jgi:hypothetical protein
MSKPLRNAEFRLPLLVWEKKLIDRRAREARLNTTDYVRERLGLEKARKKRNQREEELENPEGDPDNAVDVEELAREIYKDWPSGTVHSTMALARREAKRRLTKTAR